ncbi:MAG: dipeptidase [Chlamydiia bacterium]|nr:dipeptidase [Chlamydiia bacterium]
MMDAFRAWFSKHKEQIRAEFFQFLRFASISADPAYKTQMRQCAEWLQRYLGTFSHTEIIETPGHPLVYAEECSAGPSKPTLLIYGHYDVQPIDPVELWHSPPFEPTEREGFIYARGAVDDKGQIFYAVLAALAMKQISGKLPINLKFCIEGEEESSSMGLSRVLPKLHKKVAADYLLIPDFGQYDAATPAITLGCRGLVGLEVTLTGSSADLHSGTYGGIAYNPNRALVELLAKLWDSEGRVRVDGFYDDVEEVDAATLKNFAASNSKEQYRKEFGIAAFGGEKGRTLQEASECRPTLELNGICGGYCGAGLKTVIPAHAKAKITCRLVPNQDPAKIGRQVEAFLQKQALAGMQVKVEIYPGGAFAFRSHLRSKLAQAVASASEEVCGKACVRQLSGGSIPIIPELVKASGAEAVGMGYGLLDDAIHSPNERFDMIRFEKGFLTVARTLELL